MAGNRIDVNLSVNDDSGSLKKRNEEAKQLNQNLTKAADLAQKALKPAGAKFQAQGEGTEYGRARGSMGGTGASARDFANQAQGLGGLVRIYATVAANLFAVTAAFNALKDAANTTTMIQGMNQLGAASGIALGTMAQKFAEATDNAISLREAMGAVTKASAAGLSSKQIIEIAQYAKTASQALGLDMTDAVSRLTRGITKLEPELLDELGIFTKIGPATDKYALSVGKTAATLTDFERRQAFANAVLDEAKQKFGEINLASNPYQKLESSVRNLATAGLQLLNKFLIPLVDVLAKNSELLGLVLAGLTAKLLNMAIPALIGWRNELVKTAQVAKEKAAAINESFGEKFVQRTTAALKIPDLEKDLKKAEQDYANAKKSFLDQDNNYQRKSQSIVYKTLSTEQDIGEKIKNIRKEINQRTKEGGEENLRHAKSLETVKNTYESLLKARTALSSAEAKAEQQFQASNLEEQARLRISRRAGARAERLDILSRVGENVQAGGFKFALDELEKGLQRAVDLSGWGKLKTKIVGTFVAAAASVGIFINSLAGILNVIGVLTAAYALLNAIFSKNGDQVNDFNSQIKENASTVENATAMMKKYGDSISSASLIAKGNSFAQLSEDVDSLASKLERADKNASWFDRLVDSFKIALGGGLKQDFANSVAENLAKQLQMIPEGPLKKEIEDKIKQITGASSVAEGSLKAAFEATGNEQIVDVARRANEALKANALRAKSTSAALKTLEESVKNADDRFLELGQTLNNTDPVSKFGKALYDVGIDIARAFQGAETAIGALDELLKKPRVLELLAPDSQKELQNIRTVMESLSKQTDSYAQQVAEVQTNLQALANIDLTGATEQTVRNISEEKARLSQKLSTLTVVLDASKLNLDSLQKQLNNIITSALVKGYTLIERAATIAQQQAALSISKNLLQGLSGPGVTKALTDLNIKEIDLQIQQNNILTDLNNTMLRANALKERELAEKGISDIREKAVKESRALTTAEESQIRQFEGTIRGVDIVSGAIETRKAISAKQIKQMGAESPTAAAIAGQYAASTAGARSQQAALEAKKQIERDNARLGSAVEFRNESLKIEQSRARLIELDKQLTDLNLQLYEYLSDQQLKAKQTAESAKQQQEQLLARRTIEDEISGIQDRIAVARDRNDAKQLEMLYNLKEVKEGQLGQLDRQQVKEKQILSVQQAQAAMNNEIARANKLLEQRFTLDQQLKQIEADRLSNELELLGIRKDIELLTPQQVADQEKLIKLDQLLNQTQSETAKAAFDRSRKLNELDIKEREAKKDTATYSAEFWANERKFVDDFYTNELNKINQNNDAKKTAIDLQYSMTERMKTYDQTFQDAFKGMADAIVEFTKTGKLNFNSLIESMIAGLIKYEMQLQAMEMYKAARPGIMGFLGSFLSGFSKSGGRGMDFRDVGSFTSDAFVLPGSFAKGGAFESGVQKFAKGGMFTNSVVTQPTLFKFAQGAGLMGEAGPEAIMPLKRDNQGNLGVRTSQQQPKVDVVVNNYSNAQAETRETVDSRGNRKIEVIVGEMVAGEVSRNNSPMQQAIRSNFNSRTATIRR